MYENTRHCPFCMFFACLFAIVHFVFNQIIQIYSIYTVKLLKKCFCLSEWLFLSIVNICFWLYKVTFLMFFFCAKVIIKCLFITKKHLNLSYLSYTLCCWKTKQ